jgi:NAD(P)-dependent dehydrogenase (short-subunit alcohol dehydrogenase family)
VSKCVVVLGARNLGGAIIDHFLERGWSAAGVARSGDTLARVRDRGALALEADAADPDSLGEALRKARAEYGSVDAVVNAVSAARAPRSGGAFGGGELA